MRIPEIIRGETYLRYSEIWRMYQLGGRVYDAMRKVGLIHPIRKLDGLRTPDREVVYFLEHIFEALQHPEIYQHRKTIAKMPCFDAVTRQRILSLDLPGYLPPNPVNVYTWGYSDTFDHAFRERVREYFGRHCVECGAGEDGKRLHVHHVNTKPTDDCNDPAALFVPLCSRCHSLSHGNAENREHWRQHFTKIINGRWGGRCYLPKPEEVPA